jgi:hypothetical protein
MKSHRAQILEFLNRNRTILELRQGRRGRPEPQFRIVCSRESATRATQEAETGLAGNAAKVRVDWFWEDLIFVALAICGLAVVVLAFL